MSLHVDLGENGGVWSLGFLMETAVGSVGLGVRMYHDSIIQCIGKVRDHKWLCAISPEVQRRDKF